VDCLFEGKSILITGGTGSLGKVLLRRLLSNQHGRPKRVVVLSRDEAKQQEVRINYYHKRHPTDEVIYQNSRERLQLCIGDVRNFATVAGALRDIDVVVNAAALKQVPTCEYFPWEAVRTNVEGPENIVRAIRDLRLPVETVVSVSTDKAVEPVNVMGMTKAIQERIFLRANLDVPGTRFIAVRYGNVLASRGSVIPLFHDQIKAGGPVTITDLRMSRFLLSLEEAVDVIINAIATAKRGETYIPRVPAALIADVAKALIDGRDVKTIVVGARPGEKLHETLISEEESKRTLPRGDYYAVASILPELRAAAAGDQFLNREYTSEHDLMTVDEVRDLMVKRNLMVGQESLALDGEFLR